MLNLKIRRMIAEIRTAVDNMASKSASVPDEMRRSDFAFLPYFFT